MWIIRSRWGYVYKAGIEVTVSSKRKSDRLIFVHKSAAIDACRNALERVPSGEYKLVRLVTKREKLKRKLLARSEQFEQDAQMHAPADKHWYRGYARALRDVAGML